MSKKSKKGPVVVSVINLKGGVGKTTVAALLARHIARENLNVLAVDLDPQANLSQALMTESEYIQFMHNREPSIVELFNDYIPPSRDREAPTRLDDDKIVKSVGYGERLHLIPSRFDFSDNLICSNSVDARIFAKFISRTPKNMDLVLIDCAPTESIITKAAYHASRYILLPVRTEFLSTIGFPLLNESLKKFRSNNPGHDIDVCGVLINNSRTSGSPRGPHHDDSLNDIRQKAEEYGWPVMEEQMFHSDGYPKLMKEEYPHHVGNSWYEFPPIAEEFMKTVGLSSRRK